MSTKASRKEQQTRSQAVARIADRTAKKIVGVTLIFREIICAPTRHSQYKAAYQIL